MQPTVLMKKELLDATGLNEFPTSQEFLNQVTKELIIKANNKSIILNQSAPTFDVDEQKGETKPTQEQVDYRQKLLDSLHDLYDDAKKTIYNNALTADDKISEIDNSVQTFINDTQGLVKNTVQTRYQDGYDSMNGYLTKAKVNPPIQANEQPRLQSILRQQLQNLEDIGLIIRGRLRQKVDMNDIQSYYHFKAPKKLKQAQSDYTPCMKQQHQLHPDWTEAELESYCEEDDSSTDNVFNNAQDNLDQLGMFGWLESFMAGYLVAGLLATALISNLTILLPWLTCQDNGNCTRNGPCEDCEDMAAGGPYPIDNFPPSTLHDLCQCNDPPGAPIITFG
jgi:ElaB/YqjD/DUF883 family membrane-anchored ribosome-binding protein